MTVALVAHYLVSDTASAASLVTPSFTPAAGEVIVVTAYTQDAAKTITGCSNSGTTPQTWTSRSNTSNASNTSAAMFTTTVGASPAAMAVTVTFGGALGNVTAIEVSRWSGAQLAATPVVVAVQNATAQSSLTTAVANSVVVWGNGDWNAVAPGTPTYVGGSTALDPAFYTSSIVTIYQAYRTTTTAGPQAFGVSAPTGQAASLNAIEVQPGSGAVVANPTGGFFPFMAA